jgi:hypothetical protein
MAIFCVFITVDSRKIAIMQTASRYQGIIPNTWQEKAPVVAGKEALFLRSPRNRIFP